MRRQRCLTHCNVFRPRPVWLCKCVGVAVCYTVLCCVSMCVNFVDVLFFFLFFLVFRFFREEVRMVFVNYAVYCRIGFGTEQPALDTAKRRDASAISIF